MVDIAIVTGTYNRLAFLRRMMESARSQLDGFSYEIIIADGGSTDGTLEYLRTCRDVRLLEQGRLIGAIRAFDEAFALSTARYTLVANDDIELLPGSIPRAWAYLEDHPTCGAVAFAHNLPMPGTRPVFGSYSVALMGAKDAAGIPQQVVYAQVGMVRTWLGHACGWWGSQDPVMMSGDGTYGADNYLSARIWERGYTVDAVPCVGNHDYVPEDALRKGNRDKALSVASAFHRRYPDGVPLAPRAQDDRCGELRILYLPIFEPEIAALQRTTKRGLREALARVGRVREWDYINEPGDLTSHVCEFQPHLLFMQVHVAKYLPSHALAAARAAKPDMLVVNWNGDVWEQGLTAPEIMALLKHVDLQLTVNDSVLKTYASAGIHAAYWQYSYEPLEDVAVGRAHDVLFLGNCYSDKRAQLGAVLRGVDAAAGIYGGGWRNLKADGFNLYDYRAAAELIRAAKIVIGDNQYQARGFISNRVFETLAHGGFLLHQIVPGLDELLGLIDGEHYVAWSDFDDLRAKLAYWRDDARAGERRRIAAQGCAAVRSRHNFDVRVEELFGLIGELHVGRL